MKKILVILMSIVALFGAGCMNQIEEPAQIGEVAPENATEGIVTNALIEEEVNTTVGPLLEITSVTSDNNLLHIYVKNIGDEPATEVYCGIIAFGVSNKIAYAEYMTLEDYKVMADAVQGGMTGQTYTYETDYKYKDTPNLTLIYKLAGVDYLGDIQPGEVKKGSTEIIYGTSNSEFLKIAWIRGEEENFSIY